MMKKLLALAVVASALIGCSGDKGDGIKAEDRQALTDTNSIAKRVDGNYDKLTDAEKTQILKMANGDETQARKLLQLMAHPPNEAFLKGQRPGGTPSARPGN